MLLSRHLFALFCPNFHSWKAYLYKLFLVFIFSWYHDINDNQLANLLCRIFIILNWHFKFAFLGKWNVYSNTEIPTEKNFLTGCAQTNCYKTGSASCRTLLHQTLLSVPYYQPWQSLDVTTSGSAIIWNF